MPRKRIKSKRINNFINLKILTDDLYDSICSRITMEEMFDKSDKERQGLFFNGRDYLFFDKSNIKICKEIWQRHKNEVMRIWKSDISNSGKRPFTWWIVEAPEPKIKVKRIHKYYKYPDGQIVYTEAGDLKEERLEEETEREYLKRLNLLEEWEK